MKKQAFLLATLLLVGCADAARKPDVVLITLDTTRADYLSCYGFPDQEPTSPVLDALAAEGTRFEMAVASAAVTPVSHASILTGRFNRDHGLRVIYAGSGFRLPEDVPTLATELARQGYATIAVHSAFPVAPYFGLGGGFEVMESFDAEMAVEEGAARWDLRSSRRSDATIDLVIEKLEAVSRPFFLWVHLWDPHDTIQVPPERWLPPAAELYEQDAGGRPLRDRQGELVYRRPMKSLYAAELRYMDAQIGRLFRHLRDGGSWEETIVAVTADHGQGLQDHGWAKHRILYQEQIRVPLILRVPGADQRRVVGELARTVDIAPTLFDYAGAAMPAGMSGRSLRPLIEGQQDQARLAFAEQINGYDLNAHMVRRRPQDDFSYCAMDRDWKLIWRPNHPGLSELFEISSDPGELRNLWAWDHPEALRLKEELARHAPWVTAPFPASGDASGQEAAAQALADLGYAGDAADDEPVSGPDWEYVCPRHYAQRSPELGRCPDCGSTMILIAEGK